MGAESAEIVLVAGLIERAVPVPSAFFWKRLTHHRISLPCPAHIHPLTYSGRSPQEDVYPKGPSVQFYKMFLDEGVKTQFKAYDAFAIIEWDVLVASDQSFAQLYDAAFNNSEDFWVKGSNIEGTNFHNVAESSEMWHVMGHINGNAIYNNNDPLFVEFVEYTLARWEYQYPYDVALWATISDFPYSWPLWQHYSSKFVTTNLVRGVKSVLFLCG